jgi:hypothetical protein
MGAANGVGVPPVSEGVTMVGVLSMAEEAPRGVGAGGFSESGGLRTLAVGPDRSHRHHRCLGHRWLKGDAR